MMGDLVTQTGVAGIAVILILREIVPLLLRASRRGGNGNNAASERLATAQPFWLKTLSDLGSTQHTTLEAIRDLHAEVKRLCTILDERLPRRAP